MIALQVPPANADTSSIQKQLAAIGASTAGANAQAQIAALLASPDLPAAAQYILSTEGSTLTGFQKSLLSLIPVISSDAPALQDEINGVKSSSDAKTLGGLKEELNTNPAIKVIRQAGVQFQSSPNLASTLNSDAANLSLPITDIPPGSGIPQLDSFDNTLSNFANLANAPALAPGVTPIMSTPAFAAYVKGLNPLTAATLIPSSQLWALLLPNDHDPTTKDWVDWIGGMLVATAVFVAAVLEAPIIITAGIAFLGAVALLEFDFFTTIDCDHDGDPWDSADVAGNEC
jgi:hypothetical protein